MCLVPAVVLAATHQSDTAPRSFARYLSTLTHTTMWYRGPASLATSARTVAAKAAVSWHGILPRKSAGLQYNASILNGSVTAGRLSTGPPPASPPSASTTWW